MTRHRGGWRARPGWAGAGGPLDAVRSTQRAPPLMALSVLDDDLSEQAVGFPIGPGGEDQLVGLGGVPVAELQAPEPVDDDRLAVHPSQLAQVRARHGVVDVDVAVTEVPHEQVSAEL